MVVKITEPTYEAQDGSLHRHRSSAMQKELWNELTDDLNEMFAMPGRKIESADILNWINSNKEKVRAFINASEQMMKDVLS